MTDDAIDLVISAIEELIEDMEFRRNPSGTWGGFEERDAVRKKLRDALKKLVAHPSVELD